MVLAFLVSIVVPGAAMVVGAATQPVASTEKKPSDPPALPTSLDSAIRYPVLFQRYFNQAFAFRALLIRGFANWKVHVLGVTSSVKVTLGTSGWAFYASEFEDECYRNSRLFTPEVLEEATRTIVARRDALAARGIPYLLVIAPDKHTIYPEFMGPDVRRAGDTSRLSQLLDNLRAKSDVVVLDLRPALLRAKQDGLVYPPRDTHWSELGAFVAYQEVATALQRWFPELRVRSKSEFEVRIEAKPGDLLPMLGLEGELDEVPTLIPRTTPSAKTTKLITEPGRFGYFLATESPTGEVPRVVMFRDSYGIALIPFLSEHFGQASYYWTWGYSAELVEREHPNLVVQELVERGLMQDSTFVPRR